MAKRNQQKTNDVNPKAKKIDSLRYAEYYDMQGIYDKLYSESKQNKIFDSLMEIVLSRDNILLAYRNIKGNKGSHTPGTDGITIDDIAQIPSDKVVDKVRRILEEYKPRAVRRKDIPKEYDPSKTRPLGIPCMWDRLCGQCILQVLEPICEAKFSENSYGFRPNRNCEQAIASAYKHIQCSHLHYVVEVDIKSFFDMVDHSKLIKQIWALGIRDKKLIYIIRQMLRAPILMPDGNIEIPDKGTAQGGVCSPILANIVLNELDKWVESQWQEHPVTLKYKCGQNPNGSINKSPSYTAMKKTRLKEMFIVRYADDFRIFCRTWEAATRTMTAVTKWLEDRLRLHVAPDKTKVVNLKRQYSEFLGFKIRVHLKKKKLVVKSRIKDKALNKIADKAIKAVKEVAKASTKVSICDAIRKYNAKIIGWHNYYKFATDVSQDFGKIKNRIRIVWNNRFRKRLKKMPKEQVNSEVVKRYGKSKQIRYLCNLPIAPIGYVRTKYPLAKKRAINKYTPEGRKLIHDNLHINTGLMITLMSQRAYDRSVEYMDNRVSLFCAQYGRCAITGYEFRNTSEIHCHHIIPKELGGTDKYQNLKLIREDIHILIHASLPETINGYLQILKLLPGQIKKVNKFRSKAMLEQIVISTAIDDTS